MNATYSIDEKKIVPCDWEEIPENHLCKIDSEKFENLRYIKITPYWVISSDFNAIELEAGNSLTRVYRPCKVLGGGKLRYIDLGPVVGVEVIVKL